MNTLVFAHRGYKLVAPENTLPSFKAALKYPIDGLEIDLHMTADGELVIIHDETVDRTFNGQGYVKDMTLAQLRALDFGSWFSEHFKGIQIMRFQDFLDWLADINYKGVLLIELKTDHVDYPGIEERALEASRQHQGAWSVIFQSFNPKTLQRLYQLDTHLHIDRLSFVPNPKDFLACHADRIQHINLDLRFALNRLLLKYFNKGQKFVPWVVDDQRYLERAFRQPLSAVITNQVARATLLRDKIQGIYES
ncbi:glycerophosphodiester phosphodiesterase family protein [Oenococcus sp.]|uniref:glycerophosphodiester phosphodiesterase family protein n=1 Tax=Oenococcus sp. TaxID=1979414 RepID=UPI0039EC932A